MFVVFRNVISAFLLVSSLISPVSSTFASELSEPQGFSYALDGLANDEAYILVNVSAKGVDARGVRGFELIENTTGYTVSVPVGEPGLQLIKVKAGTYALGDMLVSRRDGLKALPFDGAERVQGISVDAQSVSYIGDWTLSRARYGQVGVDRLQLESKTYGISYDPQLLARFGSALDIVPEYMPAIAGANGNLLRGKWAYDSRGAIAGVTYY